jgi:PAS domain S-box-containing protein
MSTDAGARNSDLFKPKAPTILVVDDDPANLALATNLLAVLPYRILAAEDGESGLRRAAYAHPDLILLDVLMPGLDGYETCRRLKASNDTKDIPVIFMTAMAETEHKVKGFAAGAVDYITKPFRQEEVLARVGVHLRLRELAQRLREAKESLEIRVAQRTRELETANRELHAEILIRRQAEEALRESEQVFRTLVENLPVKVFIKDRESVYLCCSPGYARDLGIEAREIRGKTDHDFYAGELAEKYRADDRRIMKGASGEEIEEEYCVGGERLWVHTIKTPLFDESNVVTGVLGVFWDVTERKRLEEQLRQSQKMEAIGALAGGIAHDFNNLMTAVIGYSDLLKMRMQRDDPLLGDLDQIRRAGERAASLTGQLLAFSRKQVLQPQVLDINHVISDTEKMLRRIIGEHIDLVTIPGAALGRVSADPNQVQQVLLNLAVNGRDAMPRGGKLTIETGNVYLDGACARRRVDVEPGAYVLLAVSDTGCGMDAETVSHIFEPFFTTKEKGRGTGLGLATVYGIIKQSGGHIWVYSEPGKGSTFKIYLRRLDKSAASEAGPSCAWEGALPGTETVLLVEDDEQVRNMAKKGLSLHGYDVIAAGNGEEALKVLEAHEGPVRILVTDVVMPGLSGGELALRIASTHPEMKILYVSGYTDSAIVHHGVLEAGVSFLQKPFTPGALARKVREVLDGPRAPIPA